MHYVHVLDPATPELKGQSHVGYELTWLFVILQPPELKGQSHLDYELKRYTHALIACICSYGMSCLVKLMYMKLCVSCSMDRLFS